MNLPGPKLPRFNLQPGELVVTQEPQWIITLLGSCVAVTMFNARFRLAAICHARLPEPLGENEPAGDANQDFRYVSVVIPTMAEQFFRRGLSPAEVEVKMFGGGYVIDLGADPKSDCSIGDANIALARELLLSARFQIKGESVGGDRGSKILFNTQSGQVLHKRLSRRGVQV
jgi:chemotaxis protein CheD